MGTPDFAVPSLKALNNSDHEVALVVTQPDRPRGRGQKVMFSPVKEAALELGYDILQPLSVRTPEFYEKVAALSPDIFVVVAFGHILPKKSSQFLKRAQSICMLPFFRNTAVRRRFSGPL